MPDPVVQANATVRKVEQLSTVFSRQLRTVLTGIERTLRGLMTEPGGPATLQLRIRRAVGEVGLETVLTQAMAHSLDMVQARTTAVRVAAGLETTVEAGTERLLVLRQAHVGDLLDEAERMVREVVNSVLRSGVTDTPMPETLRTVEDILDAAVPRLQTIHDTVVSIYGREVEAIQAGNDPDTLFAYMGPLDDKTRDFCVDLVGKVFSRAEIDDMDNEQIDNVFLTGGGYNCRHVWMEVSQFSDLAPLAGTGQRAPDVEDALAALA